MNSWLPTSRFSTLPSPPPPPASLAGHPGASCLLPTAEAHGAVIPAPTSVSELTAKHAQSAVGAGEEADWVPAPRRPEGAGERRGSSREASLQSHLWSETSGTELCHRSCPFSQFCLTFWMKTKKYTLLLFPDDTHEERELIHQMSTWRSKQLSEGTRRMAPNQENTI